MSGMKRTEYGYVSSEEYWIDRNLEKWLKSKKECESEKCGSKMKRMKAKTSTTNSLKA